MLGACQLETSGNGKLDGYWRLERIDTLGGGVNRMEGQRIFWAFQSRLLQTSDLNGRVQACLLRFRKEKDSLLLSDPYLYNRESGDEPITQLARLVPFGLNSLDERFKVERLGRKNGVGKQEIPIVFHEVLRRNARSGGHQDPTVTHVVHEVGKSKMRKSASDFLIFFARFRYQNAE